MNTKLIWENILLKEVYGFELKHATTIAKDKASRNRKYQIFEILVIETLALLDSKTKWQTTYGNKDDGVDIIGIKKPLYTTPFIDNAPDQLYLGQIKRRSNGYRYDDFRTDINKLFEFYTSKVLYKNATLMQLIFVISSDNLNNTKNLRKNLLKEFDNKEHVVFVAGIKSPITIIDALDIIKYWSLNFGFVEKIIEDAFTEDEINQFQEFLKEIKFAGFSCSINQNKTTYVGKIQELQIKITTDLKDIPIEVCLKWIPEKTSLGKVQLISPWSLYETSGIHAYIENSYEFSVLFRGISVGKYGLGELEISFPNSDYIQRISLGDTLFKESIFPIYLEVPNYNIKSILEKNLTDTSCKFYAVAILGCGGIGKSSLLSEVMIKAINNGFYCIDIGYSHSFTSGNTFLIQIIVKLISCYLHKVVFLNQIELYIRNVLGSLYNEDWSDSLKNLISDKTFYVDHICDCIVSLLIKIVHSNPCVLWLSDLHWLNNTNAEFLRKIFFLLKINHNYLGNKLAIFLEGRDNETIIIDNKYYIPYAWEEFLRETDIECKFLKEWKKEDCSKFLDALFYQQEKTYDWEFFNSIKEKLLAKTKGIPMHILEQIKFLIEQGKIIIKSNGELYILEQNWPEILSNDLKQLINLRIQYYYKKNEVVMEYLSVYAKLNLHLIPECAKYIYKLLFRKFSEDIQTLENIPFIETKNNIFYFRHEYYSECLKSLPVKNDETIDDFIKWFQNRGSLTDYEWLCKLQLLRMYLFTDYDLLCNETIKFLEIVKDEYMKQSAYEILLDIPSNILHKKKLHFYEIKYNLCESIILTGDWKLAKKYFFELIESINLDNLQEVYYGALSYQELSNICSGELLLDESIMYADKGIEIVDKAFPIFRNEYAYNLLMEAKELLIERKAICYQFSGHVKKAFNLQREAYASALSRKDDYIMLRINYEQGGTLLHTDLDNAVELLSNCYKKATIQPMKFSEELVLIKTMELLGRTKQLYLSISNTEIDTVYYEASFLVECHQKNKYNYSASIHLITMAALVLLRDNDPQKALKYLFMSLERALNTHLNELLWKSYLNIAQVKKFLGYYDEGEYYAQKAKIILENMIQENPINQKAIVTLVYEPLEYLDKTLTSNLRKIKENLSISESGIRIHSFSWQSIKLFVMN